MKLAQICSAHGILVISDEIHAEMTYPQFRHHPFATVSEEAAACSVTFMAPSKTFNIAGIVSSYALVPDSRIREKFYSFLEAGELNAGTIFAFTATKAAYTYGAEWLQQMRSYVIENVNFVDEYLKKISVTVSPEDPEKPDEGEGGGDEGGGSGEAPDPAA